MNRTEILKLALDKAATPQEAMALAREMDAFLAGAPTLALPAPEAPTRPYTHKPAPNGRTSWTEADVTKLADLYTSGKNMEEIAQIIGRTPKAVGVAISLLRKNKPFGPTRRKRK